METFEDNAEGETTSQEEEGAMVLSNAPAEITQQQRRAIQLLLAGRTTGDVAVQLRVDRTTIWRWRRSVVFIAEYEREAREVRAAMLRDLSAATGEAIRALRVAMREGDVAAAIQLLRLTAPHLIASATAENSEPMPGTGPTSTDTGGDEDGARPAIERSN